MATLIPLLNCGTEDPATGYTELVNFDHVIRARPQRRKPFYALKVHFVDGRTELYYLAPSTATPEEAEDAVSLLLSEVQNRPNPRLLFRPTD